MIFDVFYLMIREYRKRVINIKYQINNTGWGFVTQKHMFFIKHSILRRKEKKVI